MNMRVWGLAMLMVSLNIALTANAYIATGDLWLAAAAANGVSVVVLFLVKRSIFWVSLALAAIWVSSGSIVAAFVTALAIGTVAVALNQDKLPLDVRLLWKRLSALYAA